MNVKYWGWVVTIAFGCASYLIYHVQSSHPFAEISASAHTYLISRGMIEDRVSAIGRLQPIRTVDVGTQVSGQLEALFVNVGDEVSFQQPLAKIADDLYNARVEASFAGVVMLKAQLEERQRRLEQETNNQLRMAHLAQSKFVSKKEIENQDVALKTASSAIAILKAEINRANAILRVDQINLKYTNIVAPISGTITSISAQKGQTLSAIQDAPTIVSIADLHGMTVEAYVSEADINKIAKGSKAFFSILGEHNRRWTGSVRQINPRPEIMNNVVLYKTMFDVDNADSVLKIGMTAQVHFTIAQANNALIIPISFLHFNGNNFEQSRQNGAIGQAATVYILEGEKVSKRDVRIGVRNRMSAEILSGLNEGDTVVLNGD